MPSPVIKRSVVIGGHKTSISIEDLFWQTLKDIAHERQTTLSVLVGSIDAQRPENSNLSSAIRVYILSHLRSRLIDLTQQRVTQVFGAKDAPTASGGSQGVS